MLKKKNLQDFLIYISRDLKNSLGMIYKVIEQERSSIAVNWAEFIYMILG